MLQQRFVRYVRARRLLRPGECVLAAVSGGVDSIVLLHLLDTSKDALEITLKAAHFDHAMREDSALDASFVRDLCDQLEIPLVLERSGRVLRGEAEARRERYAFFDRARRQLECDRVALAHHADDQVETVLFRLLRGAGLRGLSGMPVKRGVFIRPLLRFKKKELLAYARAHDLAYREDPTNRDTGHARNRIRNVLLPAIDAARPDVRASLLSLSRHAARSERAWRDRIGNLVKEAVVAESENQIDLDREKLLEMDDEARARLIRHLLRRFQVVPTRAHTASILAFLARGHSGRALAVAHMRIERSFDRVRLARPQRSQGRQLRLVDAAGAARLQLGGRHYDVEWSVSDERPAGALSFDPSILEHDLVLRPWRPGDRIRLGYGTKKLKKLFAERRVPAAERSAVPVLSDSGGRVYWVAGIAQGVDAPAPENGLALNITVRNAEFE